MARDIAVGIDVGTYQVKVVVAERMKGERQPRIIGTGMCESKGLRHGYVINQLEVARAVKTAVKQAEHASKVRITEAFISVGGVVLTAFRESGSLAIARTDITINEDDVRLATENAERALSQDKIQNRRIISTIHIEYVVDRVSALGNPVGMKGHELAARVLFVSCLEHHLRDLIDALGDAGIEVIDIFPAPIAASLVTLTKSQKIAGCVLVNIGSETVSLSVFENNIPVSLEIFPVGSTNITNDIALGMKISLEEAELVKRGGITSSTYPKKKLDEIVHSRLSDIFDLVEAHLRSIGRSGLLPAGIVITGGGAGIATIEDFAKAALRLPSKIAHIHIGEDGRAPKDSIWAVAYGLCILGMHAEGTGYSLSHLFHKPKLSSLATAIKEFFVKLLP